MRKTYLVDITDTAKRDLASTYDIIARDKPKAGVKWLRKIDQHIRSLKRLPLRYEQIPEAEEIGSPYRHILHVQYRIIYKVEEKLVTIVRVIHAARLLNPRFFDE